VAGRRARSDSVDTGVERRRAATQEIPCPEGLTLDTPEMEILWRQYTRMRTESDWREGDLVSLHQAARYELRVRQAEQVLAVQGEAPPAGGSCAQDDQPKVVDFAGSRIDCEHGCQGNQPAGSAYPGRR
jgi:hypothetical protein